jgi:hypothetical protein
MQKDKNGNGFEALQEEVVEAMREFSVNNPEIAEAMRVMNMSMPDYLQAMQSVREAETFSCSSDSHVRLNVGY